MRVLVCLAYPGYLRYYDSTINLLADRGHDVYVLFEQNKQPEGIKALRSAPNIHLLERLPRRSPVWTSTPAEIRRIADFARYLDPQLADAEYLRRRAVPVMHPSLSSLERVPVLPAGVHRRVMRAFDVCEQSIPPLPGFQRLLRDVNPSVVFASPVIIPSSRQPDLIKAAHSLGIPTVMGVASWDHLSSKGVLRVMPDQVLLWNDVQRNEAESLHGVPRSRIAVTGAQPWDRWFEREPSTSRQEFCTKVGLRTDRQFVLFVGSTQSISMPNSELDFVSDWVRSLRASDRATLRDLGVLVRPHPYNPGLWQKADLSEFGEAVVWPRDGANPVDEGDRTDYFDSLYYASAVVGINTSAMMEAAIARRPVLTIRTERFSDSQRGTVHFNYLLPERGGFVRVADSLEEHDAQLAEVIERPEIVRADIERFLASFVRPNGLSRASTPIVVDAIEAMAYAGREPEGRMPLRHYPVRCGLWSLGVAGLFVGERTTLARGAMAARARAAGAAHRGAATVESVSHALAAVLRAADRLAWDDQGPLSRTSIRVERTGKMVSKRLSAGIGVVDAGARRRIHAFHRREVEKQRRRREARRMRSIEVRPGWSPSTPVPTEEVVEP